MRSGRIAGVAVVYEKGLNEEKSVPDFKVRLAQRERAKLKLLAKLKKQAPGV